MAADLIARALAARAKKESQIIQDQLNKLDKKLFIGNYVDFPITGEVGSLYVATDRHIIYSWDAAEQQYIPYNSGGGTDYYDSLKNLPTINGVTIIGDKTGEDFKLYEWTQI